MNFINQRIGVRQLCCQAFAGACQASKEISQHALQLLGALEMVPDGERNMTRETWRWRLDMAGTCSESSRLGPYHDHWTIVTYSRT